MLGFKLSFIWVMILVEGARFLTGYSSDYESAEDKCVTSYAARFVKFELVPDVIDKAPKRIADLTYRTGHSAKGGNVLTPTWIIDEPNVSYDADPSKFYTVMIIDPDAPSRENPTNREYRHWLVGNVQGSYVGCGLTITPYLAPKPPNGTSYHRYTFLVYQQPGEINFSEQNTTLSEEGRGMFSAQKFSEENEFGEPYAGNFFLAKWKPSVPAPVSR